MFETYNLLILFVAALPVVVQAPALEVAELLCASGAIQCEVQPSSIDGDGPSSTVNPDNRAPMVVGVPAGVAWTDQLYSFQPAVVDPDGDQLEFRIVNAPTWASFDSFTGRLTGTPTPEHTGVSQGITVVVSDGIHVLELPPFSIEVRAQAPGYAVLSWVAPTQNTDGSVLTDLAGFIVRYGSAPDALDAELRIPSPGVAGCELRELAAGDWYFEVSAYNHAGVESDPSGRVYKSIS